MLCIITFDINSSSLHPFDPVQHPCCSGIRVLSSLYFCSHLLVIDVIVLYIVDRKVTGLYFLVFQCFHFFGIFSTCRKCC